MRSRRRASVLDRARFFFTRRTVSVESSRSSRRRLQGRGAAGTIERKRPFRGKLSGNRLLAIWNMLPGNPEDNPQLARVAEPQHVLFPNPPRAVCEELGLNWWAAVKLHEDGWLSFAPQDVTRLDEAQEAELRFVGSLVAGGCDRDMLASLLSSLSRPYAYHGHRLFFDWRARRWRLLPDPTADSETVFSDWVERLVQSGDMDALNGILGLVRDGLTRARIEKAQQKFHHLPGNGSAGRAWDQS